MITSNAALKKILANCKSLQKILIPLAKSLNHVLAQDITTPLDFPPFSKSAMDGYAIAKGDMGTEFQVVGEIAAGQTCSQKIRKGTAVKIMTGAMIPANTGRVIMKEHVAELGADQIKIIKNNPKSNICQQGEDIKKGTRLYTKGEIITPITLANIAFTGQRKFYVYQQPKLGIIVTGSELLGPSQKYQQGKIYDSNGPLLTSLLNKFGFTKNTARRAKDSFSSLQKTFERVLKNHDTVFFTGGVSVGEYDFIYDLLMEMGCQIHFNQVSIQPGKPLTFATYKGKPIFCFPGNPVSVFTTFYLFALPGLYKMMGHDFQHQICEYKLGKIFERNRAERELYFPIKYVGQDIVEPIKHMGSGDLYSLSKAQGLMVVPIGKKALDKGSTVKTIRL
ncbi:MAG: molybdopterin molybdotransferase MoeA [Gammaproteobacteria bacterium]|nr:molybdopterin molybdotransferase MoeA [Gammaproteobacteria bacterium]